jgi:hypothetical protein
VKIFFVITAVITILGFSTAAAGHAEEESKKALDATKNGSEGCLATSLLDFRNEIRWNAHVIVATSIDELQVLHSLLSVCQFAFLSPKEDSNNDDHDELDGQADSWDDSKRTLAALPPCHAATAEHDQRDE